MTTADYIKSLKFEKTRLFFRENKVLESYRLDKGEQLIILDIQSEKNIINSLILEDGNINPNFKEVKAFENADLFFKTFHFGLDRFCPTYKLPFFDFAIIFEKGNDICGGINIDLKNRISQSIGGKTLTVSIAFAESIFQICQDLNLPLNHLRTPFQLRIYQYWRNFLFPFDFFYNPVFKFFESSLGNELMKFGYGITISRLEIEPINGIVSKNQIERIQSLRRLKNKLNDFLVDNFWEIYQSDREECELPVLDDEEQLMYFIEAKSFHVPQNHEEPIIIHFKTWDDEHGQSVAYYDEDKIIFK